MKKIIVSTKLRIAIWSVAGALLLYSLLGFLILPAVLSKKVPELVQEKLHRVMKIDEIQFNPFSMDLDIRGLEIQNIDTSIFASFDRLYTNIDVLQSIFDLSLKMDQIVLEYPYISVKRDKQGDFNFTDLLSDEQPTAEEKKAEGDVFPVTISRIAIIKGKLSWEDTLYSNVQREDIHSLTVNIDNFTTKGGKHSQLGFSLKFASGGQFDWRGQLKLKPLESSGHIKLDKINLHHLWELFLRENFNFDIQKGTELIEADYHFTDTAEGVQLVINKASLDVSNFLLTEKGKTEPLISVPDYRVSGISVNLLKKSIEIADISVNDAQFKAWLNSDGNINYQSLFGKDVEEKQAPEQAPEVDKKNAGQWQISVKKLALNNFALHFVDKTLQTPSDLKLTSLNLSATDITNKPGAELPFYLDLTLNDKGSIKIKGNTVLEPLSSNIQLDVAETAIKDFQPYFD